MSTPATSGSTPHSTGGSAVISCYVRHISFFPSLLAKRSPPSFLLLLLLPASPGSTFNVQHWAPNATSPLNTSPRTKLIACNRTALLLIVCNALPLEILCLIFAKLGFTADSEQTVMTFLWSEWRWWAGCDVCYFGTGAFLPSPCFTSIEGDTDTGYLSERRSNSTATRHCKRCCTWAKSAESWCRSRCSPSRSRTYAAAPWIAPIIASIPCVSPPFIPFPLEDSL